MNCESYNPIICCFPDAIDPVYMCVSPHDGTESAPDDTTGCTFSEGVGTAVIAVTVEQDDKNEYKTLGKR